MRRGLLVGLVILMAGIVANAQRTTEIETWRQLSVKGTVKDESGVPVNGAIVKVAVQESILGYSMVDESGHYEIHFKTDAQQVTVSAECLGYESVTVTRPCSSTAGCNLTMKEKPTALKEVVVRAPAIHQRGDTLSYSLSAYATRGDYTLKDAIKKLPGIDVTEAGAIKYLGKDISKFYIEGMDLLGGKYNIATTNIPASYVNQVQVLSNHQEAKVDKDVFSDDVAINIKLSDKAKLKPTGTYEASAGYGDDWLYSLSGAGMLFTPKTQAIATIKTGNITSFATNGGETLTGASDPESKAFELLGNLSTSQAPLKPERFISPSDILV
ncbi:MAG TPA: lantibiotic ABC transporter, partial [Rikenellaceae bacterium]|nr:lantibiotic ABC transporter [Rikenellaceae bacterium]